MLYKIVQKLLLLRRHLKGRTLLFVHIGKCGGASLEKELRGSPLIQREYRRILNVHIRKPPTSSTADYVIVVRNPIARALSAFNWRYYLTVEQQSQRRRFPGEYRILSKYGNLNNLAEALFEEGVLVEEVANEFESVHHLRENISFYLDELLGSVKASQIFAVFTTEFLDQEMQQILGSTPTNRVHEHKSRTSAHQNNLSDRAIKNLSRYLAADFQAVEELCDMAEIEAVKRETLLRYRSF